MPLHSLTVCIPPPSTVTGPISWWAVCTTIKRHWIPVLRSQHPPRSSTQHYPEPLLDVDPRPSTLPEPRHNSLSTALFRCILNAYSRHTPHYVGSLLPRGPDTVLGSWSVARSGLAILVPRVPPSSRLHPHVRMSQGERQAARHRDKPPR